MNNKNREGRKISSLMLRFFFQKLTKVLVAAMATRGTALSDDEDSEVASTVPEGHFTVFAVKYKETQRFILELEYLIS
ncbi:hypothetical protein SLEP1_g48529 [Rubroshorea leprosula]|uniref:Uncharacterized protein n=1 Tax=Rubroshorea leprosula TaxID=152421 RepID=A0AAV5LTZ6_9ROSI|nr:hypothetical protein SLEP1_g48529 [Rubroshorea leprosula]